VLGSARVACSTRNAASTGLSPPRLLFYVAIPHRQATANRNAAPTVATASQHVRQRAIVRLPKLVGADEQANVAATGEDESDDSDLGHRMIRSSSVESSGRTLPSRRDPRSSFPEGRSANELARSREGAAARVGRALTRATARSITMNIAGEPRLLRRWVTCDEQSRSSYSERSPDRTAGRTRRTRNASSRTKAPT